jgi:SAM-dependent methyltransferase
VLEIGAGIGNVTGRLMARRTFYLAGERDPLHLHALRNRFLRTPNVTVQAIDPETTDFASLGAFDTALCLNVLEYAENPGAMVKSLAAAVKPGGNLIVLAPNNPALYGTLDRAMGHKRRFRERDLRETLEGCGFTVEKVHRLRSGAPAWWIYGKLLHRNRVNKFALKIFDKSVWFWRRVDPLLPWGALSLIVVARRNDAKGL